MYKFLLTIIETWQTRRRYRYLRRCLSTSCTFSNSDVSIRKDIFLLSKPQPACRRGGGVEPLGPLLYKLVCCTYGWCTTAAYFSAQGPTLETLDYILSVWIGSTPTHRLVSLLCLRSTLRLLNTPVACF